MNMSYIRRGSQGFSLIEFMIAMLLGTILIGGAISVYLASKRSYIEVEQVAGLSENGRFSLRIINDSLRHIGFFGSARPGDIADDVNLGAVSSDCTGDAAAYDLTSVIAVGIVDSSGDAYGCIDDAVEGTQVLVVKYLVPSPIYDEDPDDPNAVLDGDLEFPSPPDPNETYVIANSEFGVLMDGADTAVTVPDVSDGQEFARAVGWPYRFQAYYVRELAIIINGVSRLRKTLVRKTLVWNGASMEVQTEELVEGVERFYLRFGYDTDNDGDIDTYTVEATDLAAASWDWDTVISIEVFVLVRSPDEDSGYTDAKTYNLGDVTITPSSNADYPVNMRRLMMHSTISLRNPKLIIRGGA